MENEFDRHADDYDRTLRASLPAGMEEDAYFARYKVDYLTDASRGRDIRRLLDFGCGAGRSLQYLDAALRSPRYMDSIRRKNRCDTPRNACRATLVDDWQLLVGQRFDVVFAANVFHHIARVELAQWLRRCGEVLMPGGGCSCSSTTRAIRSRAGCSSAVRSMSTRR